MTTSFEPGENVVVLPIPSTLDRDRPVLSIDTLIPGITPTDEVKRFPFEYSTLVNIECDTSANLNTLLRSQATIPFFTLPVIVKGTLPLIIAVPEKSAGAVVEVGTHVILYDPILSWTLLKYLSASLLGTPFQV